MIGKCLTLGCLAAALVVLPSGAKAFDSKTDDIRFRLGAGVTISSELEDMTEDYKLDVSGDWGWLDLNAGVEIPITGSISLIPYAAFYINQFSGDDDSVNMMVVPALAAKFVMNQSESMTDYWYPNADLDTYLQLEVNYGIPLETSDEMEMESGGIGFAGLIGVQLDYGYDLGLGYSYIPIEDDFENDRNMGGFLVRLNKSF